MPEHGDDEIDQHHAGHAKDDAAADEIPRRKIGKGRRDLVGIVEQQQIVGGAVDDQRDQRGDEGPQPQIADQQTVDGAERRAADERRDDHGRHRPVQHVEAEQRAEIAQREYRADREVDAADDDDQRDAEHDKTDFAGLAAGIGEAAGRQEARDRAAEQDRDDQEDDDRDRGFGPPLGQDFAEQMIRPVAVSQTKEDVLHRQSGKWRKLEGSGPIRRERPCRGTAARRSARKAGYFLRSLRFQQAVSLDAFSLVIGISVVYIDPFTEPGFTPEETSHLIMPAICSAWVGTS